MAELEETIQMILINPHPVLAPNPPSLTSLFLVLAPTQQAAQPHGHKLSPGVMSRRLPPLQEILAR